MFPSLAKILLSSALLHTSLAVSSSAQQPLFGGGAPSFADAARANTTVDGLATLHLSTLRDGGDFAALTHPHFPGYGVRIKKTEFCDPTVNVYTGYLDVQQGAKHLFFSFFESRRNPDRDDVMMWINGGPGCSSSMGLLMELGPCSIDMSNAPGAAHAPVPSGNGTLWNPYSWNNEANIFFLDQPVGVGFSYQDHGDAVGTTEDAAKDLHAFLSIFFETFPQFSGRALHLSGESYGGRYLPVFASEIYDQNSVAQAEGRPQINLQSVVIGNGITDITTLYPGRYAIECSTAALAVPPQSIRACVGIKRALPRCQSALERSCVQAFDTIDCRAAVRFCEDELGTPMRRSGMNNYDVSKPCVGGGLCYLENSVIEAYLNDPATQELLGVDPGITFASCAQLVGEAFAQHMDKWRVNTQDYIAGLLERGVRVLIYAGTYDWQCNWVANRDWLEKLQWRGAAGYATAPWRSWALSNGSEAAGETKRWGNLTFATLLGAGHMVPHDKPAEAAAMISRWLAQREL
ncbi:peptidase S10 serine carboxypeptidase [Gloeopeniophorella convolvens]|nr:peptidase S10 serine carboxypeptidase [Gloeopeniophorella convolvens]